ncbi:putative polysaccharide biosynthesis protein [Falsibacillus pallidus]|uniref:putative polysaccharide biosynthesis protein n=1 Tax=Falsibacillus pallidus TaxID=493781 RepID=UPI003D995615
MPQDHSRDLFKGAFILTIAALVTKILSAVYRVPFQNIVGDVGFYIYQQVYPIYGIALALSTYGFPVILSRMIAEEQHHAEGHKKINHLIRVSFFTLLIIGVIFFLVFYTGASLLAGWMGDERLAPLIKFISFSFLLLPFLSIGRGYFQGKGNMVPTAVSQVAEQLVRVATILVLSSVFIAQGRSLYEAGEGALSGSLTGGAAAILVLVLFISIYRETMIFQGSPAEAEDLFKWSRILIFQGMAICISGMLLVLLQLADSLSLYSSLVKSGVGINEAKVLKGIYDRGQPLVQLGTVVSTSLSLALVPIVTTAFRKGQKALLEGKMTAALKVSLAAGTGAAIGLINILGPVNEMLFENRDGTGVLQIFSLSILFTSIILTLLGLLQGLGHPYAPMKYIVAGVLLKYMGNLCLVPIWGTAGAAAATVFSLIFVSVFLLLKVKSMFGKTFLSLRFIGEVAFAALIMTIVLQIWLWGGSHIASMLHGGRASSIILSLVGVGAGGAAYIAVITRRGLFQSHEIILLPFGSKLLKLQNKLRKKR